MFCLENKILSKISGANQAFLLLEFIILLFSSKRADTTAQVTGNSYSSKIFNKLLQISLSNDIICLNFSDLFYPICPMLTQDLLIR